MADITDQLQEFRPATPVASATPAPDITDTLTERKESPDVTTSLKEADQLDLGDLEVLKRDKEAFNPAAYVSANPNVFQDPKKTAKLLSVWKAQQDLPTDWGKVLSEAGKTITGEAEVKPGEKPKPGIGIQILQGAADLATRAGEIVAPLGRAAKEAFVGETLDAKKLKQRQYAEAAETAKAKKSAAEIVAGSEAAGTGLADLARTGGRKLHMMGKKYADLSDQEALQMLMADTEFTKQAEKVAAGEGETMQEIGLDSETLAKEGISLDTDAIQRLSLVDPVTMVATAGVFKVVGAGGKVLATASSRVGAEKVLEGLTKLGAKSVKAVGTGIEKAATGVQEALPLTGRGAAGTAGTAALLHAAGIPAPVTAGVRVGASIIKPIGRTIKEVGQAALKEAPEVGGQKLFQFATDPSAGEHIYNAIKATAPVVKPIAKGVTSGVVGSVPFVLAAQDEKTKGAFLGAGTLLGAAHGTLGIPGEIVGRTYFDPRKIPFEPRESNPYGTSAGLDSAHEAAMKTLPENDRNAINNFREDLRDHGHEIYAVDNDTYRNVLREDAVRAFTEAEGKPPTPEDLKAIDGELESRGIEKIRVVGDDGKPHEVTLINANHPKAIFHEAGHLFERSLKDSLRSELMGAAEKYYTPEQLDSLAADISKRLQRERPLDMNNPGDRDFVLREVIAEGYNTLFQNRGLELTRKPGFWRDLAQTAAEGAEALGVLPKGGRETPGLQIEPSVRLQEHLRRMGEEVLKGPEYPEPAGPVTPEEVKPVAEAPKAPAEPAPKTTPFAAPVRTGPRDISAERAEETNQGVADKWAEDKPNKDVVAEVSRAFDENVGLKLEHRGAPVEKFNATEPERAAEIESGRGLPAEARELHGKTLRPTRWEPTKSGEPQLVGRSGDKVLANIDRSVQWMKKAGEEMPWQTDESGRLTRAGLDELMSDLNTYWDNQDRGFRGGGKELVRPPEELGAAIPQQRGEGIALPDIKEQFLNLVQGKDIGPPETVRAAKGKLPANIKAAEIRRAQGLKTEPIAGREPQVYPAKVTAGRGEVALQETNPLRNRLRAAGMPVEDLHTVVERLNASDITRAERAPGLKGRGGSTDIARAGFLPGESHRGSMSVADYAEQIFNLNPQQWRDTTNKWGGLTNEAWRLGLSLKDRSELNTLKEYMDRASSRSKELISSGDFDNAIPAVTKAQFYREAWEAAQGIKSAKVGFEMKYPGKKVEVPFPTPEFDSTEVSKVKSGENFGQTFNADGSVANIAGQPVDIVTLASKNIPRDSLTPESIQDFISQYPEVSKLPEFKAGVFNLELTGPNGEPLTSIDVNVAVPQEHRANTEAFARENNQQGIWDAAKSEEIKTGGTGETVLKDPAQILEAARKLIRGEKAFLPKQKIEKIPSYIDTSLEQGRISAILSDIIRTKGVTEQFWLNSKTGKVLLAPDGHIERARELGGIPVGADAPEIYDLMEQKGYLRGVNFGESTVYLNGAPELSRAAKQTMEDIAFASGKQIIHNSKRIIERPRPPGEEPAFLPSELSKQKRDERGRPLTKEGLVDYNKLALEQQEKQKKEAGEIDFTKYEVPAEPEEKTVTPVNTETPSEPLTVYHFGADGISVTEPSRMKNSVHQFWGEIPKTFFFVEGSEANPGAQFAGRTVYKATIDKSKLYDATEKGDPLNFFRPNRSEADAAVRDAGYQGVLIPIKGGKKVVVMYDPVKVEPAGETTKEGTFRKQLFPKEIPSDEAITEALSSDKRPFVGLNRDLEQGHPVGLRIDIPAYVRTGTHVITVHEKAEGGKVGKRIGYDGIAAVDNPVFFSNEAGATRIKEGAKKFPVATVEGNYDPETRTLPEDVADWTEVGYNPKSHSYFYEKATGEPVESGSKAVSVGNSVFVKDPVFGNREDYAYLPVEEDLSGPAIKLKSGRVVAGGNHLEILDSLAKKGEDITGHKQGFLTTTGRFLNREQAAKFGTEIGQIPEEAVRGGRLDSVDFEYYRQFLPAEKKKKVIKVKDMTPREQKEVIKSIQDEAEIKYPEAKIPQFVYNEDGSPKIAYGDMLGRQVEFYNFADTKRAQKAAKGLEGKAAVEAGAKELGDRLVKYYDRIKDNPEIAAGADWYSLARKNLVKIFGDDAKFFAELLGATSPQTDVKQNFKYALDAYNRFKAGAFDDILSKYREGKQKWATGDIQDYLDDTGKKLTGPKVKQATRGHFLNWWIEKNDLTPYRSEVNAEGKPLKYGMHSKSLLRVFDGTWLQEVTGPKTPNFMGNLTGDTFEATIDIWAARALHRMGAEEAGKRWRILPESETGVTDKDFEFGQKAFRHAAEKIGIQPDALQAILWFAEKDHWDKNGWIKSGAAGAEKSDFNTFFAKTKRVGPGQIELTEEPRPKKAKKKLAVDIKEGDVKGVKKEIQFLPGEIVPRERFRVERPTRIGQNRRGFWETVLEGGTRPAIFNSKAEAEKFVASEELKDARIVPLSTPTRQEIKLGPSVTYVEEKRSNYD